MSVLKGAVIAAAGLGSRLGLGMPKCMIELGKQTILTRLIRTLENHVESIHVVVGYREEIVIDYCARHHRDVVLVRNSDFRITNAAYSFALGARYLSGKILFTDGDMVVSPRDIVEFIKRSCDEEILIGLTEPKSEQAVYASAKELKGEILVENFSRQNSDKFEWANIVIGPSDLMNGVDGFVFEHLAKKLPLKGHMLRLAEVDTAADLRVAEQFIRNQG